MFFFCSSLILNLSVTKFDNIFFLRTALYVCGIPRGKCSGLRKRVVFFLPIFLEFHEIVVFLYCDGTKLPSSDAVPLGI